MSWHTTKSSGVDASKVCEPTLTTAKWPSHEVVNDQQWCNINSQCIVCCACSFGRMCTHRFHTCWANQTLGVAGMCYVHVKVVMIQNRVLTLGMSAGHAEMDGHRTTKVHIWASQGVIISIMIRVLNMLLISHRILTDTRFRVWYTFNHCLDCLVGTSWQISSICLVELAWCWEQVVLVTMKEVVLCVCLFQLYEYVYSTCQCHQRVQVAEDKLLCVGVRIFVNGVSSLSNVLCSKSQSLENRFFMLGID